MLHALEWILFGAASVGAIVYGVIRFRPVRRGPWLLIAASIACLAIGDIFYAFGQFAIADVCYLSMFVTVGLSLLQLTRGGTLLITRARLIDLVAGACALLLVIWVFVIGDSNLLGDISPTDVIGALLLIGVAGRLIAATWFNWSAILLCVGATGMLSSDIAYGLHPSWWTEAGYMVLYLAWGGAALHPSMVELTAPMPTRQTPWKGRWAALLGISVATPPVVLLIEALSGSVTDGVVIAVAGAITLVLMITRLSDSVLLSIQAVARERALREASAALVAAPDENAVDEAVRAAVAKLLPPTEVLFATDDRKLALAALPTVPAGPGSRSWFLPSAPALASSATASPATSSAATASAASPSEATPTEATPTEATPTEATSSPAGSSQRRKQDTEATLVCPLWLEPLAVARPSGGALVLSGRREILAARRDALEVLAGQAALALDRIALVEAIGRRDSDLYLRAVIRNTADIMLVTDEDQVIRYASPALRELLGENELPPFATLVDLVHPDDRAHVRRKLRENGDGVVHCALQRSDETQVLVEATYRDLRDDRLVQGYVVTMRDVTKAHDPAERIPHLEHVDELPAWVNRRSAQHKFRY